MAAPASLEGLQQTVEAAVADLQRHRLLPMQKDAYICAAKCCDSGQSMQGVQRCIDNCQVRIQNANLTVQRMLGEFQERVQRCMMRCQDSAQESLPSNPTPKDAAKAEGVLVSCLDACGKEYSGKVTKLKADAEAQLKKLA